MQMKLGDNPNLQGNVALRQHSRGKSIQKWTQLWGKCPADLVSIACRYQLKTKESAIERSVKDRCASVGLQTQVLG